MDELISSSYQITILKDSYWETEFKNALDGPFKAAWDTKFLNKEESLQSDFSSMMTLVRTGRYAMYNYLPSIKTLEEFKECKISDVGFSLKQIYLAFALQKNSPYKEVLNRALSKMLENGEIGRFKSKDLEKVPECAENGRGKSLGFETVVFPIGIFLVGIGCSLLLFFSELVVFCLARSVMIKG